MKAVAYALEKADSVEQAAAALAAGGWGCKPVAGGQSLGAMINLRLAQPETLIDLDTIADMRKVTVLDGAVLYGAMTTHASVEDGIAPDAANGLMARVARGIAYRAVRNRGTMGGSLCHADPAADWVTTMPLLDAMMIAHGPAGIREIPAPVFMRGPFETALEEGELLLAIRVPHRSPQMRWSYRKYCRKTGEFAMAIAAAIYDPVDACERLVLGGLDGAPQVINRTGILKDIASSTGRAALIASTVPEIDATRQSLLAEMLRLVSSDLEKTA
jgi:carbon-monoxide dehydrogenase medium subunit